MLGDSVSGDRVISLLEMDLKDIEFNCLIVNIQKTHSFNTSTQNFLEL